MPERALIDSDPNLPALDDPQLARAAAAGDAAACRLIMQRNNRRLFRVARSVLQNDGEAEEVVQEAYLRAFAKMADFRGDSRLATWLTRIALNEALGRRRRRRPSEQLSVDEDGAARLGATIVAFPAMSADEDPERTASRRQIAAVVERAIDALPEPFRLVFVMRAVEEMSVEETAAELAIPEATVKTRLHRARALLRKAVQAEIGSVLNEAFPFAGRRCVRFTERVIARLPVTVSAGAPPDNSAKGEESCET
jgi:RNA polymerase sigma-70 factor (ECF subfamily)